MPSALSYRVRQIEDALDVLLFDRSARQARLTEAGAELLREAARLLGEIDAVANRVKRVATGWEPMLTIAVDSVIARDPMLDLASAFYALEPADAPASCATRRCSGTIEALTSGEADLAIGAVLDAASLAFTATGIRSRPLGELRFVYRGGAAPSAGAHRRAADRRRAAPAPRGGRGRLLARRRRA